MKKYKNIQYLRVLSCLGVVLVHLGQRLGLHSGTLYSFTHFGAMGVYLFFIISGFLGFYTYVSSKESIQSYWLKRLFRIIPIYYSIIIYDMILYTFFIKGIPVDIYGLGWARYFLFISQCIPGEDFWRNLSMTWTISVFILFYLLMPLLRKCVSSLKSSIAALLLFYVVAQLIGNSNEWFTPIFYLYFFMFGVVAYFAINEHKEDITCIFFSIIMILELILGNINGTTYACIFTIILIVSRDFEVKNNFFDKIIQTLDKYSFTIYLVQAIVMEAISIVMAIRSLSPISIVVSSIIGISIISYIVHNFIEVPVQKLVKKIL